MSREQAKVSLARRRFKIAAVVAKATSRTNFEPTTQREEIAAVRSKNEFLEVPLKFQQRFYPDEIRKGAIFHKISIRLRKILTDDGAVINIPKEKSDEKSPFY